MQLVNKKYILISIVFSLLFSGCSFSSNPVKKEDMITKREYKNISKDAIFYAAKKAFVFSGSGVFFLDSYRNSLYVTRTKMIHYPTYATTFEDRWNISIIERDNTSFAKLSAKRVHNFDEKDITYLSKKSQNLLWERIDYFLGIQNKWYSCDFLHEFTNGDEALCDNVDLKVLREPNQNDVIKEIYISDRKVSSDIVDIKSDVLSEDIVLTIDEDKTDILEKEDKIEETDTSEDKLDELDKEIEQLDKKVSENIDETLEKIEENSEN